MSKRTLIFIVFILCLLFGYYQSKKNINEMNDIYTTTKVLFDNFSNPNFENFKEISTDSIYCILCFDLPNFDSKRPYDLDRKSFFDNHLKNITNSETFKKAIKSDEFKIFHNKDSGGIEVLITTFKKDELSKNHQGEQLCFHLKEIEREYKFIGISTIP